MPKISVILCAYNAEETLSAAVQSVLGQTQGDLELIIVNDGSRDETQAVASQFCQEDKRVRLVNIENGGLSNARNVGIKEAQGDFIAFCDADDKVDGMAFEIMLRAIETDGTDMVMCGYFHDTEQPDGTVSSIAVSQPRAVYMTREELFGGIVGLKSKFIFDASWNKLFKRSVIAENGLLMRVGELFEDTAFVISFLECSPKVSVLPDCFYHYIQRSNGSITKKFDPRKLNDLKRRYEQLAEFCAMADSDVKRFVELYYIKNVYSALANSFDSNEFSKRERKLLFKEEFSSQKFKQCAKNAKGIGRSDALTVFVARLGWLWLNRFYCKGIHYMKSRAATLFAKVK